MAILKPDRRVLDIGLDGAVIFIPFFKLNRDFRKSFLRTTVAGERTTKSIKIPYQNNEKNYFTVEMIDDYRGKGIIIKFAFSKFFNNHNLYFTKIKNAKKVFKIIRRKLAEIGILSKIKNYSFLDYELGFNDVNSNMIFEQKKLFKDISRATKKRHSLFGRFIESDRFCNETEDRISGRSALRGVDRFKNYCKTTEMLERSGTELQVNITRSELMFNKDYLLKHIKTNNCLEVIKSMILLYKQRIEKIFSNLKENTFMDKKKLKEDIIEFKKENKQGLPKFLKGKEYFDKNILIEVLKDLHEVLNRQSSRYIKMVEEEINDQQEKFNEIKLRLENFFCIAFSNPMQNKDGSKNGIHTENIGLQSDLVTEIISYFSPLSKIEGRLKIIDLEE